MPPLAGLKVLELARVLAGPWAGQTLADLGADVIKVESPAGDDTRSWGPPFVRYDDGTRDAVYYHSCNRGKRSIAIDFRQPEGQAIVRRLATRSDVVIENFKVGGLKKFGLDYEALATLNPLLVYCSVTGFGQDGPAAGRAGYDVIAQGMGGIMDISGEAERGPQKVGVAVVDLLTGVYAVVAIQAALAARERTGRGQHIDMSLLDTMASILSNPGLSYLVSGKVPRRMGNGHPSIVPYQDFPTRDGPVIIAVGNDAQFRQFVGVLAVPALADDPHYATNEARVANRQALVARLAEVTARYQRQDLLDRLEAAGVPAGAINRIDEVFAEPQVVHRQLRLDLDRGDGATVPTIRSPFLFSDTRAVYERPSPRLGEHSREILAELDYDNAAIEGLVGSGTVRQL